jgi:hypothetical protein
MAGRRHDGSPIHVCNDDLLPVTTYDVSGLAPGTPSLCPSNWLDVNPADRRFFLSSGPFTMLPGDTQVVIVAIEVGRSADRIASIAALKTTAMSVRTLYDAGFLDPPTAVEAFLIESSAEPGAVHLSWHVPDSPGTPVTVERRTTESAWGAVGDVVLPPDRILRFDDTAVVPGERYGYRIAMWRGAERDHSSETWIEVPLAPDAPTTIRLLPGRPNPSSSSFQIRHYAPRSGSFRLDVLDVQGRVIRTLTDADLSPGWYETRWDGRDGAGKDAPSGIYFLRIEGPGEVKTCKLVMMR